ncbi:putative quinol monooxygenase [Vibrio owensii]
MRLTLSNLEPIEAQITQSKRENYDHRYSNRQSKTSIQIAFYRAHGGAGKVVRAEDGCITYQQNISADDENTLFLYEEWQSEQQLKAHLATAHMTEHFELARPWFDSVEMKTFEATETQA